MTVCAIIDSDNFVINLIVADPTDLAPDGCGLILKPDDVFVDIGYIWDGVSFNAPQSDETEITGE